MIYENIRALREQNHLTQTQLAQKLHMAQNETGKIEWTAPLLIQLAQLYGVSVDYLLGLKAK